MSSVQPENGLPGHRVITADSFRALKLKLAGASQPASKPSLDWMEPPAVPAPPLQASPFVEEDEPAAASQAALPEAALPEMAALSKPSGQDATMPDLAEFAADLALPSSVPHDPAAMLVELLVSAPVDQVPDVGEEQAPPAFVDGTTEPDADVAPATFADSNFVERRLLETPEQGEDAEAGMRAHALLDIMAIPTEGALPQERALANDTLLRLIPRMPIKSLRHLAERVCLMATPSQMLVRRLINHPRIEVVGPLLENATTVDDSDLVAVAQTRNRAKLKLIARRRTISPALAEALIQSNDIETLGNLLRNTGASFSIESMWHLTRFAAAHPSLQAPLVTRADTPSPIAFQLFWRLPSELRRYVLSRFLTDSATITRILTMNRENDGSGERKNADPALLEKLAGAPTEEAAEIYARLTHVSAQTGIQIAEDAGGEAMTIALKAAGLTRAQFADIVAKRKDADALQSIFDTLSFNKARVLLTYWDWAVKRTGPYARVAIG